MEPINEKAVIPFRDLPNVVGYALVTMKKIVKGVETEVESIQFFVKQKMPVDALSIDERIPAAIEGIDTDVVEVGEVVALDVPFAGTPSGERTKIWRPAPPGVSIGHFAISAGTFGCLMADAVSGEPLILSNNHVLANADMREHQWATKGDMIFQPGPYDIKTGIDPKIHKIAELERWIPVTSDPAADETVDAAVAKPTGAYVVSPILDIGDLDDIGKGPTGASDLLGDFKDNLPLCKSGRTTGYNETKIAVPSLAMKVSGYHGKTCNFRDVFGTLPCASGGDSGSAYVWKDAARGKVFMGLLFAGSASITIGCKSFHVVNRLKLKLFRGELPPPPPGKKYALQLYVQDEKVYETVADKLAWRILDKPKVDVQVEER